MSKLDEVAGTFAWAAPELLLGQRCSEKVDIFAFGVVRPSQLTLYSVASSLLSALPRLQAMYMLLSGSFGYDIWGIMSACLVVFS